MDPVLLTLAGKALQLVAPYVARGGEKVAEALGEEIGAQVKGLVERIRARFRREPANAEVLDQYAADPQANEGAAKATLARELEADPAFRAQVEADVNRFGTVLSVVQRVKEGRVIDAGEIENAKNALLQYVQEADKVDEMRGPKIRNLGS